ncbi:saccharopine dehydrogenase NADP-binding domain-containing protein [Echinicola sp. CAU 1574]|uniref:Saccharopine dehydrogenase NADP-binding domain-containing protein n=1 Tax=Echinicola arenosa TaxID=2774144 RepID=A0ABR9AH90_9BACT|nr:saccharopine dehydrogenase C-terminal domain-containing protein [Echinicola arenosa]MBD8488080.1 saccharopine dehydrogenase NADP-binding domain-containing protein [Echinicola arenosa]
MKTILIIGAGKSSKVLLDYLLEEAYSKRRFIILADNDLAEAFNKLEGHPNGEAVRLDVQDVTLRRTLISKSDVVISMLPAFLHPLVAEDCLELGKHFFSASYESSQMKEMSSAIKEKDLLFLNECGLDPGIDHMSAMQIIDREKETGGKIELFKSYCGGLLSPESERDNPWRYKFTWNPRNVVLAGHGVSRFIRNGRYKFIPYHMLFRRTDLIQFDDVGDFDGYANRDSLSYRAVYGLEDIPTIIRGTLRRAGFCRSWDVLVQLGLTDDSFSMSLPRDFTKRMFVNAFLPYDMMFGVEEKLKRILPWVDDEIMSKLEWLGLFDEEALPLFEGSPATILQQILEDKWRMKKEDKDMVVMQHQFLVKYYHGKEKSIHSSLVVKGENNVYTAMAKTVGLPLAAAVDLFLDGKIKFRGLCLPTLKEIYLPVLDVLESKGIRFVEKEKLL